MAKYDPLHDYLKSRNQNEIVMDFQEIEKVLGTKLPPSARKHSAWWAKGEPGQHVQKRAWLDAGFIVESFDFVRQRVIFRRAK